MLVLKRRREQAFTVGDYTVKVVAIGQDWVKLGITTPAGIRIIWRRSEIIENGVAATEPAPKPYDASL